jgi:ATP-dependent Clp protease ATP-binding subunit ClpC
MDDDLPYLALTPRMKRTMENADRIAAGRGHDYVGTEHLLLALLDDPDGIAGSAIRRLGFEPALRATVEGILASVGYQTPSSELRGP